MKYNAIKVFFFFNGECKIKSMVQNKEMVIKNMVTGKCKLKGVK